MRPRKFLIDPSQNSQTPNAMYNEYFPPDSAQHPPSQPHKKDHQQNSRNYHIKEAPSSMGHRFDSARNPFLQDQKVPSRNKGTKQMVIKPSNKPPKMTPSQNCFNNYENPKHKRDLCNEDDLEVFFR